jgi:hypothetical protein
MPRSSPSTLQFAAAAGLAALIWTATPAMAFETTAPAAVTDARTAPAGKQSGVVTAKSPWRTVSTATKHRKSRGFRVAAYQYSDPSYWDVYRADLIGSYSGCYFWCGRGFPLMTGIAY